MACEEAGLGIYSGLAKHVFPDAYIAGFNITGTMPFMLLYKCVEYIHMVFDQSHSPVDLFPVDPLGLMSVGNAFVGFGLEFLLSVSSGEGAWFRTTTSGAAFALPTISAGFELYDGFVYNLWNAKDYRGPFESLTLNLDMGFKKWPKGGWSLFWDAKRGFAGPWGGASTFFSISASLTHGLEGFSLARSTTHYTMLGEPDQSHTRSDIVGSIITILLATKFIEAIDKGGNVTPLACWLLETSLWGHTGIAHHYWDRKESQYNMDARRNSDKRPDEFRSGPSYWLVPGL
jgi:hypothetical protein